MSDNQDSSQKVLMKGYFAPGKKPTGEQFSAFIDLATDASELEGVIATERLPDATTDVKGAVELATDAEVTAGATSHVVTTAGLSTALFSGGAIGAGGLDASLLPDATADVKGAVELATDVEVTAGASSHVVTTAGLSTALFSGGTISASGLDATLLPDATAEVKGAVELATDAEVTAGASSHVVTTAGLSTALFSGGTISASGLDATLLPDATADVKGAVELATDAEVTAGASSHVVTTAGLSTALFSGGTISASGLDATLLPDATSDVKGAVELATDAEVTAGTSSHVVTTAGLSNALFSGGAIGAGGLDASLLPDATADVKGVVELATDAEVTAGASSHVVTTAGLSTALFSGGTIGAGGFDASLLPDATADVKGAVELATDAEVTAGTSSHVITASGLSTALFSGGTVSAGGLDSVLLPAASNSIKGGVMLASADEITNGVSTNVVTTVGLKAAKFDASQTFKEVVADNASDLQSKIDALTEGQVLAVYQSNS